MPQSSAMCIWILRHGRVASHYKVKESGGMPILPSMIMNVRATSSLHLSNNLTGFAKTFNHLLTFFSPADGVLALLEKVIKFLRFVHVLEKFFLHFFTRMSVEIAVSTLILRVGQT